MKKFILLALCSMTLAGGFSSPGFAVEQNELDASFPGAKEIIKIWFQNYKGPGGETVFQGEGNVEEAEKILTAATKHLKKAVMR